MFILRFWGLLSVGLFLPVFHSLYFLLLCELQLLTPQSSKTSVFFCLYYCTSCVILCTSCVILLIKKCRNLMRYTSVLQHSFLESLCLLFPKSSVMSPTIAQLNYQCGVLAVFILRFWFSSFLQFSYFKNLFLNLKLICQL